MMAEPSKRSPEDLIRPEDIKDRIIACLLMVAGLLSGLADETEWICSHDTEHMWEASSPHLS
jgi:hypothetical protein